MALWNSKKKINELALYQDYLITFGSPEGKRVLIDLCRANGVFDGGFDPDPYLNALASGERNSILRILTILKMTDEDIAGLSSSED